MERSWLLTIRKVIFACLFVFTFAASSYASEVFIEVTNRNGEPEMNFGEIDLADDNIDFIQMKVRVYGNGLSDKNYKVYHVINEALEIDNIEQKDALIFDPEAFSDKGKALINYGRDEVVSGYDEHQTIYESPDINYEDTFYVNYKLNKEKLLTNGTLRGKILFVVKADNNEKVYQEFDIRAEIDGLAPISVKTSYLDEETIMIEPYLESYDEDDVYIDLKAFSPSQRAYSIKAVFPELVINETSGDILNKDFLELKLSSSNRISTNYTTYNTINLETEQEIASFDAFEEAEAKIYIKVNESKLASLQPGTYRSYLRLLLDDGGEDFWADIPFILDIPRIFSLEVTADEIEELDFDTLERDKTEKRTMNLKVYNNTGNAYTIAQNFVWPKAMETGVKLPEESFKVQVELESKYKGKAMYPQQALVKEGSDDIFVSDASGSPVELKVTYYMKLPRETAKGTYNSSISYSLLENN